MSFSFHLSAILCSYWTFLFPFFHSLSHFFFFFFCRNTLNTLQNFLFALSLWPQMDRFPEVVIMSWVRRMCQSNFSRCYFCCWEFLSFFSCSSRGSNFELKTTVCDVKANVWSPRALPLLCLTAERSSHTHTHTHALHKQAVLVHSDHSRQETKTMHSDSLETETGDHSFTLAHIYVCI